MTLRCCVFLCQIHMHFAFKVLSVPGRLSAELSSLLGYYAFLIQIRMRFAFRVLSVPGRLTAELHSLLGFCVLLHHIDMHFTFRILPVLGRSSYLEGRCRGGRPFGKLGPIRFWLGHASCRRCVRACGFSLAAPRCPGIVPFAVPTTED